MTDQDCNNNLVTSEECKQGFKNMSTECACLPELWCRNGSSIPTEHCRLLCYPKKVVGCEHWGANCQTCQQAKNVNPCVYKDIVGTCQGNGTCRYLDQSKYQNSECVIISQNNLYKITSCRTI